MIQVRECAGHLLMMPCGSKRYPLKRADPGSAGLDICSPQDYIVAPRGQVVIPIGWKLCFDLGYYGKIESRSSIVTQKRLTVEAGVIDSSYRGEVCKF